MKIVQLTAENVKKLTAVEISPDGNMVQITGKNGQGKTSVLDSIWWALTSSSNIQSQPIRTGQTKAKIVLKLGTGKDVAMVVERRFTPSASYLEVKTADGAKYPSPQKMLEELVGALAFDPLDFMRRDGKGQFDVLKGLVKLDVDLIASAAADKADYAKRTDLNRDAKAKRNLAAAIKVPADLPPKPISENAILDAIQESADQNADIERRRANRETAKARVVQLRQDADNLESTMDVDNENVLTAAGRECAILEQQINELTDRIKAIQSAAATRVSEQTEQRAAAILNARGEADEIEQKLGEAGELPDLVDIAKLRSDLETARSTNEHIQNREHKAAIAAEAESLEKQSQALTDAMSKRAKERDDAIAAAKMPIEGLSFGEGTVTFKGLPLEQASDAEQLMVSTAIAAALNPKLRVIRIRDGSLLDDDAMKNLAAFADANDMQVWIERVDGSGTVGIVMEDGHVRGQAQKQPAAKDDLLAAEA